MSGSEATVKILSLGSKGDGLAEGPDGAIHIPMSLPGETLSITRDGNRGTITKIITPSTDRVKPVCRHFNRCGGCSLQHMARPAYLAWKHDLVRQALADSGIDCDVEPMREIGVGTRRRAVFAARRTKKTVQLGFHAPREHVVIDLEDCPVLHPVILRLLPQLKQLVEPLLTRRGEIRITVTAAVNGLDVAITGVSSERKPNAEQRLALAAQSLEIGVIRLSLDDELIAMKMQPIVTFAGVDVPLPAGTFLQSSTQADALIADLVLEGLMLNGGSEGQKVADLFSGPGTLSLPLARRFAVHAIDNDGPAIDALDEAVRCASGLKPLTTLKRDLFREPLAGKELVGLNAVVFDPPRAGAKAQAYELARKSTHELAGSTINRIVAVSCNPTTMARDLRILLDGGYRLERVTPVDQFLYSAHVEAIAVLLR